MGTLAVYLEQEGVPTTGISLVRLHTEKIRPPRAVWVPYEFGRPLGAPGEPAFQRRLMMTALELLEAPSGPVLVDFEDEPPAAATVADEADETEGWTCPIPLRRVADPTPDPGGWRALLSEEIGRIRPFHDLAVAGRGRTTFGAAGLEPDALVRFLAGFFGDGVPQSPHPDLAPGALLKVATEDLKAFYGEAATAQPGLRRATSREIEDWIWGATVLGRMMLALKTACLASPDDLVRRTAMFNLVPRSQLHRAEGEAALNFEVPRDGHLA